VVLDIWQEVTGVHLVEDLRRRLYGGKRAGRAARLVNSM
jgi:hypothetical protein